MGIGDDEPDTFLVNAKSAARFRDCMKSETDKKKRTTLLIVEPCIVSTNLRFFQYASVKIARTKKVMPQVKNLTQGSTKRVPRVDVSRARGCGATVARLIMHM